MSPPLMMTMNWEAAIKCRPKKVVRFLREHPQYATHTVNICTEQKAKVPNFVGGALPRSDQATGRITA